MHTLYVEKPMRGAKKLTERLDETLRKYHNRAVDSVQVIEELIALARQLGEAVQRGEELGSVGISACELLLVALV